MYVQHLYFICCFLNQRQCGRNIQTVNPSHFNKQEISTHTVSVSYLVHCNLMKFMFAFC